MSAFDLTIVPLAQGLDAALLAIPAAAGVGQIVAEGERNLVIGRPANLRKWTAGHLGRARLAKATPGKLPPRPPTDLTPIATAVAYVTTSSPFAQRLAYERVMARYVPLARRRDLERPAFLRLALEGGYPHLAIQPSRDGADVFGPFRDSRAATRARDALYKHFRLRPCDFDFKPPSGLANGLPAEVARALDGFGAITEIPGWVRRAGGRSLVADRGRDGVELYPIAGGSVIEEAMVTAADDAVEQAVEGLQWTGATLDDDTPWLNAWRHGKRTGVEIPLRPDEPAASIAARVRGAMGTPSAPVVG